MLNIDYILLELYVYWSLTSFCLFYLIYLWWPIIVLSLTSLVLSWFLIPIRRREWEGVWVTSLVLKPYYLCWIQGSLLMNLGFTWNTAIDSGRAVYKANLSDSNHECWLNSGVWSLFSLQESIRPGWKVPLWQKNRQFSHIILHLSFSQSTHFQLRRSIFIHNIVTELKLSSI